ncbi:glycosyltransferase [Prosthecomicrobium sp. N25]|uniref:glycosyltransferase n=1 Tax=Prosthecomicrobium sp. N25 TaxID=3129254 RepID=UPI00307694D0
MTRAGSRYEVVFIEEPFYADVPDSFLESTCEGKVNVLVPMLPERLYGADPAPTLRHLLDGWLAPRRAGRTLLYWYYTPAALAFSDPEDADAVVYDNMDELSQFKGADPALVALEDELIAKADLVFTGGQSLYDAKRHRHPSIHLFPSSIDRDHFGRALAGPPEPADLAGLPRPRLGFFGVIDERLDLDLLSGLALARPDWTFVMIGPVVKISEADLPAAPNIRWLGARPYADLPAYLGHIDVGIMPFALNAATEFISPTKTPEFLAAGLPVVSTPIRDVVRPYGEKGLVRIAGDLAAFTAECETAARTRDPAWQEAVRRHLAVMSWDRTWRAMQALIDGLRRTEPARAEVRPGRTGAHYV